MHNTQKTVRQKIFTPSISELTEQRGRVRSEIKNKDRYKNTAGFFVIPPWVSYEKRKISLKEEINSAHEDQ